jgi:hypothetical protein
LALVVSLVKGCSVWETLKRAGIAYLVFFFLAGVLLLIFRAGVLAESRPASPPPSVPETGRKGPPPR